MAKTRTLAIIILLTGIFGAAIWLAIPGQVSPASPPPEPLASQNKRPSGSTAAKLKSIRLPAFKVEDISVGEFVEYLRVRSIAYDQSPGDFAGVDIRIFNPPPEVLSAEAKVAGGLGVSCPAEELRIRELHLPSTTVGEVLLYAFESSKLRYEIRDEIIWIYHILHPPTPYEKSRAPDLEPGPEIDPTGRD